MKTIIKTGLVAPFILAAGMAHAVTVDFGDIDWGDEIQYISPAVTGPIDDTFTFNLLNDGYFEGGVTWLNVPDNGEDLVFSVSYEGDPLGDFTYYFPGGPVPAQAFQAGEYSINVTGFAESEESYGFTATVVPEPSTYALMLGGLGLVGFMAARRRAKQE